MVSTITYTDKDGWSRHRKGIGTWFRESFYFEDITTKDKRILTYVVTDAVIKSDTRYDYPVLWDTVELEYSTDLVRHEYNIKEDGTVDLNPYTRVQILGRGDIIHKFGSNKENNKAALAWIARAKKYLTPILKADIAKYHRKDYPYNELWNIGREWVDLDEQLERDLPF